MDGESQQREEQTSTPNMSVDRLEALAPRRTMGLNEDNPSPGLTTPNPATSTTFHTKPTTININSTKATTPPTTTSSQFLDRILSRVKMLGRTRAGRASENSRNFETNALPAPNLAAPTAAPQPGRKGSGLAGCEDQVAILSTTVDSHSSLNKESGNTILEWHDNGEKNMKVNDLVPFCEQLDCLLEYIQSKRDINHLIYSYPSELQNALDTKAQTLHNIYLEARAACLRIQQVKNQRKAVRKECKAMEKVFALIKDEEIKEMENYITLYDKTLMTRWEKIRGLTQEDVVDSFIQDIKGKQKALEYLHTLATNKLNQVHKNVTKLTPEETKPGSLAIKRLSTNGAARNSGRWRNKHHEKVIKSSTNAPPLDTNFTLPIVPLASVPFSLTLGPTFSGVNSEEPSRTPAPNTFGSASSSLIPQSGLSTQMAPNMRSSPTVNIPERQSVLQALFSDMQHPSTHDNLPINAVMPRLMAGTSAARAGGSGRGQNQNANISGNTSTNHDIELFTLHDPT